MIRHISAIAEVVDDVDAAVEFYRDVLGLTVDHQPGGGYATVEIHGVLHFSVWSRSAAAEATYGDKAAVDRIPSASPWSFEVDSVNSATDAIGERGWEFVQPPKTESWGQATSRFMLPSGMLGGFSETPWARRITQDLKAASE